MPDTPRDLNLEVNQTDPKALPRGKNHLLVIGIDAYQDNRIANLQNARADAVTVADLLRKKYAFEGEDIRLLNADASRARIYKALDHFIDHSGEEDSLLIFFSGHGYFRKNLNRGYLVPADAQVGAFDSFLSNTVLLEDYLPSIPARHVVMIVDSCFSGSLFKSVDFESRELSEHNLREMMGARSRLGIAAGSIELVSDGLVGNHSPFASSLIHHLRENQRNYLPVLDLFHPVSQMTTYSANQRPVYGVMAKSQHVPGAQFVLTLKRNQAADYQAAVEVGTATALTRFLAAYPEYPQRAEVEARIAGLRDEEAWAKACAHDKIVAYRQYLNAFPGGTHTRDAIARMGELEEDQVFARAKRRGEAALRQYLLDYSPSGRHLDAAKAEIKRIEQHHAELENQQQQEAEKARQEAAARQQAERERQAREAEKRRQAEREAKAREAREAEAAFWKKTRQDHSPAAYQAYLDRYPKGQHREDARRWKISRKKQEDLWHQAVRKDTVAAYRLYLEIYSDAGQPHHQEAKARIAELEAAEEPVPPWYRHRLVRAALIALPLLLISFWAIPQLMPGGDEPASTGDTLTGTQQPIMQADPNPASEQPLSGFDLPTQPQPEEPAPTAIDPLEALADQGYDILDPWVADRAAYRAPNGRMGLLDRAGNLLGQTYKKVEDLSSGYAVFHDEQNRRGYLSLQSGEVVIKAQYASAARFDGSGRARVRTQDGRRQTIDTDGDCVQGCETASVAQPVEASSNSKEIPLPQMVRIPGGSFQMGSNEDYSDDNPPHRVTVSTFYLAETEVTFAQYDYFCQQTGRSNPDDEGWGRGNRPVINVSWNDAQAYCQWVSQQTRQRYRLPTEAEWEYAAGGGSSGRTKYAGTSSEGSLGSYAVYSNNSGSKTSPVKSKRPNGLGLYDMSGNVSEWCQDWYGAYPSSAQVDPQGPSQGSSRVIRGGGWYYFAGYCRTAYRSFDSPDNRDLNLGFRLVRVP